VGVQDLIARIQKIARLHADAKVTCRIADLDKLGYAEIVPDINVYDQHTVRYSFRQLGDGEMQAFVSENDSDIRRKTHLFDSLWLQGTSFPPSAGGARSSGPGTG